MAHGELVLECMETLQSLKICGREFFRCSAPVVGSALRLLFLLHHRVGQDCPGLQPTVMGDLLKLARPTIPSLVNTLQEQGLEERLSGDGERRVDYVRPTQRGTALVRRDKDEASRCLEEYMDY